MRKLIIIIACITLSFTLITGCSKEEAVKLENENENAIVVESNLSDEIEDTSWSNETRILSEGEYAVLYSFEEIISVSDTIVVGKPISKKVNDVYVFEFSVTEILKGAIEEKTIHLYTGESIFEKNKEYVLYLDKEKLPYYDHIVYNLVQNTYSNFESNKPTITRLRNSKYDKVELTNESLMTKISSTHDTSEYSPNAIVTHTDSSDMNEIISISDYVVEIKVIKILITTNSVNVVECKIINSYKGDLKGDVIIYLPNSFEKNKEYVVTLNEVDGSYMMTSIHGFIDKDNDEEIKKILKLLKKDN